MARFARRESTKNCLFRLFFGYLGIWVCSRQLRGLISYCRVSYCHGGRCMRDQVSNVSGPSQIDVPVDWYLGVILALTDSL